MTKSYRVFTSAPPELGSTSNASWIFASSTASSPLLPPATLDHVDHQISLLYQNVIFSGNDEEQEESGEQQSFEYGNNPTIEWPLPDKVDASAHPNTTNIDSSHIEQTFETDLTCEGVTMQSEGSSISSFPLFNFSVNILSSLSSIMHARNPDIASVKVTLLLGVLEVDGPSYVAQKTGAYAGREIALLKLIVGDEYGALCKLVAWREIAERWGGLMEEPNVKRGDIVLFENVLVSSAGHDRQVSAVKAQITASPNLKSQAQICYRTLPRTDEDRKWRPDLRLANSVPAVRRVSQVVEWMERMAGIPTK